MKELPSYHRDEIKILLTSSIKFFDNIEIKSEDDFSNYFYWKGRCFALDLLYKSKDVVLNADIEDLRIEAATAMNEAKKIFDSLRNGDSFGTLIQQGYHLLYLMGSVYVLDELRGEIGEDIKQLLREKDGLHLGAV